MLREGLTREVIIIVLLIFFAIVGYIFRDPITIRLVTVKQYAVEGPLAGVIDYGQQMASILKNKLDQIDKKDLEKIPLARQHLGAVDFIQTALMASRILSRHGGATSSRPQTTTGTTNTTAGTGAAATKPATSHEGAAGGGGTGPGAGKHTADAKEKEKEKEAEHIAIPSNEDVISSAFEAPEWACDESHSQNYMIYCQGDLLHAVMMLNIFKDSKTFVDKPLKRDPAEVAADFKRKFPRDITVNDREAVRLFIEENFDEEGHELEE
ncbi:unnamed protein product [Gongylonema pulchrum]|uniref:Trehalase n=1 Tax=Gongylonema pulchrum TaxID=637853 RepID=A0A183D1I2_9BILA|nr:unnamed protein product [Gongylonema pulchrum]